MILYEVNLIIESSIIIPYTKFLKDHIKEMLSFNGFIKANLWEEIIDDSTKHLTVSYTLKSMEQLQEYFDNHADFMRSKAVNLFSSKFKATRRIFKDIDYLSPF